MNNKLEIFIEKKNVKSQSHWLPLLEGSISACGAPGKNAVREWSNKGVTDVITLQREDEMNSWLPGICNSNGLTWHHFPLSGRNLCDKNDIIQLKRINEIVCLLKDFKTRHIVIHCSAGMHRTGVFLYFLLRRIGSDDIIHSIAQIRQLTADELNRSDGKLFLEAEDLYNKIIFDI
ncbi:tyrosine-protein phosphatase [Candidatus Uabimicrobium sp. HlEnr_7]|uniref:tyrosine-protein phosphatase n=1 Tax=Candidatus Uabimicrobium helgolandensis TaxID=3095367 RepID=UPI0035576AC6